MDMVAVTLTSAAIVEVTGRAVSPGSFVKPGLELKPAAPRLWATDGEATIKAAADAAAVSNRRCMLLLLSSGREPIRLRDPVVAR